MPKIVINRSSEYSNKLRKIEIHIENKKIGEINDGETKEFVVEPDEHKLTAKIDWCKSKDLIISVKDEETKTIDLSSRNPIESLYFVTFRKDRYLQLKLTEK